MQDQPAVLWEPTAQQRERSALWGFALQAHAEAEAPRPVGAPAADYHALWQWSVDQPGAFWDALRQFAGIVGDFDSAVPLSRGDRMPGARWFEGARLNYAENLLAIGADHAIAIVFTNEAGATQRLTRGELRSQVAAIAAGLRAAGIGPGDIVAGYLPNIPEAVIAMLATTALGAVWTSTSPDFGLEGLLDRFGQVRPKLVFTADGYVYAGKRHDCLAVARQLQDRVDSIGRVVVIAYATAAPDLSAHAGMQSWQDFAKPGTALAFARVAFDAPLFILYSSGTTGRPKCIVHGVGGTLLQHAKEHRLHADIGPGDALFFYTTCGWMMWNWLVSGLAAGATIVLFDGSPVHPDPGVLWRLADEATVTHFGTSPRYLAALEKAGYAPLTQHALPQLRCLLSTGSPLGPAQFHFVYAQIKPQLQLASISGGTDIISCFCLGVPWLPVRAGELQGPGLGMNVQVWNERGERLQGSAGELVCTQPFPSMPVGFWNDAEGKRYRAAYFERFPGAWHHGDRVVETASHGFVFLGRSDAVLNPGGVRIGTAEIYRQLDAFPEIAEAVAVGQTVRDAAGNTDERVLLFLRLQEGADSDQDALFDRVRRRLRDNASPRHVPARIVVVPDIPRTRSGKTVELAVKHVVNGLPVDNVEALANPEALRHFRDLPQLQT